MEPLIQQITFNNGQSLSLDSDSIVVFVGPNNVGKSRSLNDIQGLLMTATHPSVVLSQLALNIPSQDEIVEHLEAHSIQTENGYYPYYKGFGFYLSKSQSRFHFTDCLGEVASAYCAKADTEMRLQIASNAAPGGFDERSHPLDFAINESSRHFLQKGFERAFGTALIMDPCSRMGSRVRVGEPISMPSGTFDESALYQYIEAVEQLPGLHEQGDGMKSFVGTLMYLMVDYLRVFLIDEPEAFLHPPQAIQMGRSIGEGLTKDQQAFISTHSKEIVLGLLEACPERVKVVRITRNGHENSFHVLENDAISKIWNDPLLRNSNILEGLFFSEVVLCESDADCAFYRMIKQSVDAEQGIQTECLFVHCGGKGRMPIVVNALRSIGVPVKVVADFDMLASEQTLQRLVEAMGHEWDDISQEYASLRDSLKKPDAASGTDLLDDVIRLLEPLGDNPVPNDVLKSLRNLAETPGRWGDLSRYGIDAIPAGQQREMCERIVGKLRSWNIHLVREGCLEQLVPTIGNHGPKWLNKVLEDHPDANDAAYATAKEFVKGW